MKPEVELLAWSVAQIAEACGMSEGYVKKEIREGKLRARKFGRLTRVDRVELEAWIFSRRYRETTSAD